MTIYFPDLSGHQAGLRLERKTVAVIAKATEGTTFHDLSYPSFKRQARRRKSVFAAYHWLWSGSPTEAEWAFAHVGPKVPLMIDAENLSVNTSVAMILSFVHYYRKLGGIVHTVYLPKWYWESRLGSPDLTALGKAGLLLVASDYISYSDNGEGWQPYGGLTPVWWQYTDRLGYAGHSVDFNAFKGTVQELSNVLNYGTLTGPKPDPKPTPKPKPAGPSNIGDARKSLLAALKFHPGVIGRKIRQALRSLRGL